MICTECLADRECEGLWTRHDPACLWCGARLIQKIGRLRLGVTESTARKRAMLDAWVAQGHAESEVRALAKEDKLVFQPKPDVRKQLRK